MTMSKKLVTIAVAALAVGAAAPAVAMSGLSRTSAGSSITASAVADSASVRHLSLRSMPVGTVDFQRHLHGGIQAQIDVFGLTPGSTHSVEIDAAGRPVVRLGALTADATGRADGTLTAAFSGALPNGSRVVLRLGLTGGDANLNVMAAEPIAESAVIAGRPTGHQYRLTAVDVTPNGVNEGTLSGRATVKYNAAAHTLTVTVNATGLTPGAHAAHIHIGSCERQGAVAYMLMDFTADGHGRISGETRTVTGVTNAPPAQGWYLNLHQGDSNSIVVNGKPALSFRPLLCANF